MVSIIRSWQFHCTPGRLCAPTQASYVRCLGDFGISSSEFPSVHGIDSDRPKAVDARFPLCDEFESAANAHAKTLYRISKTAVVQPGAHGAEHRASISDRILDAEFIAITRYSCLALDDRSLLPAEDFSCAEAYSSSCSPVLSVSETSQLQCPFTRTASLRIIDCCAFVSALLPPCPPQNHSRRIDMPSPVTASSVLCSADLGQWIK